MGATVEAQTKTPEQLHAEAAYAIEQHGLVRHSYLLAKAGLAAAIDSLTLEQAKRARLKLEAEARICEQDHPAKPTGKKFSANEASDVVQIDSAYAAHKAEVARLERVKYHAERDVEDKAYQVENARLKAELAISAFRIAGGLR